MIKLLHVTDGWAMNRYYVEGRRITEEIFDDLRLRAIHSGTMDPILRNKLWYKYREISL